MRPRSTATTTPDEPSSPNSPAPEKPGTDDDDSLVEAVIEEVKELPEELAEATEAVREDIEASPVGQAAIRAYLWVMEHGPKSTRGRVIFAGALGLVVLLPSLAMLYFSLTVGQEATESWFGKLGYAGIFLANLASTATLFIPVPGLTAAAQALIISSGKVLSPVWVGVFGGLGMALGEITAYVAGMAASVIAREEEIKPPARLKPVIDWLTHKVDWLMDHYGMPTLFVLSAVPNPFFEIAGWTAGATRYSFWRFMAAVTPGKITRGILLAYLGEKIIFG